MWTLSDNFDRMNMVIMLVYGHKTESKFFLKSEWGKKSEKFMQM